MTLLANLVEVSRKVGSTTRKKEKISLLAHFFRQAKGREIALTACYLSGRLPHGRLGVGWATLLETFKDLPDQSRPLSLIEIDHLFKGILKERGAGSLEKRVKLLRDLFSYTRKSETEFLTRLIMGEIRQGALEGLVLEAIAEASFLPIDRLRQSLRFSGDIGDVAKVALEEGMAGLSRFQPRLFHPISPMLANPAEGEAEALARLGEAGWEYKIDGARIQIKG